MAVKVDHQLVMVNVKIIWNGQKIKEKCMKRRERKGMLKEQRKEDTGQLMDTTTEGWVIQNLRRYHNSLVPNDVLKALNGRMDLIPVLIEYASGIHVKIQSEGDSIIAWEILGEQ